MPIVSRNVREIQESGDFMPEKPCKTLAACRNLAAWVLLGEPGAGKSEALKSEAATTDGLYLSVAEFLNLDIDEVWRGKTLFLDGLDETRADDGAESTLLRVRARLKVLGNPPYRIACRAADWFGSTDRQTLQAASPDGRLVVLLLEPLSSQDILDILRENFDVADPEDFVEKARGHGVDGLLQNPQTLGLLAQAIRGQQWPESRLKVFELACEKLAHEENRKHRNRQRAHALQTQRVLDAAGQLCAALLFADKAGIALDRDVSNERFPPLEAFCPPDPEMVSSTLRTRLFMPSVGSEERMVPSHRSIAEFLAARWLASQVDEHGLPLGRVLNLLLGIDGRTVSGLRGLYAWLALCCHAARSRLIDTDPLTVIIYGDVGPMSLEDKRQLLVCFRKEAEQHTAFRWEARIDHPFGALADQRLAADFRQILESPRRSDADQTMVDCVLTVLAEGEPMPELVDAVKGVFVDSTRWGRARREALEIWIELDGSPKEAREILDAMADGRIVDSDDELSGILIGHLYPGEIAPEDLLRYLHVPKEQSLIGSYAWFWEHELPQKAPESHLPVLLDGLANRNDLATSDERMEFHLRRMIGALLVRAVESQGESIDDKRLFTWLGIGAGEFGDIEREEADRKAIALWLELHPERYKGVLALCYLDAVDKAKPGEYLYVEEGRLHGAMPPADIGLWHLDQAAQSVNGSVAGNHLYEAVSCLCRQKGHSGMSLETLEEWGKRHPDKQRLLQSMLVVAIPESRKDGAIRKSESKKKRDELRRERRVQLSNHLYAIQSGKANTALMHELAGVWLDHCTDTHGATPRERFDSYCENGDEILLLAEFGFRACVERDNLPSVSEIIDLGIKRHEHFIRKPCLVGMELRWRDGGCGIETLADDTLRRMVAFRLTYGADNTPEWFTYLVKNRAALVSDVLIAYASATLKAKQDYLDSIYPLAHDPDYRELAQLAVPAILERFPLRARTGQLNHLERLLKAALRYALPQLPSLLEKKTAIKSLDVAQKVYWLTCGMLLDPEKYEDVLWRYVGSSVSRVNGVSAFISEQFGELGAEYRLSAATLGRLIELLAPHAVLDRQRGGGLVNEAMRRGDHVRALITRLGALGTKKSEQEIERLLALPALTKLKLSLENSLHQSLLIQRENAFRFPALDGVVKILANREPEGVPDLAELVLAHLDDLARDVRQDNSDLFRQFWTEAEENVPKPENSCRDALLDKLKSRLVSFGLDCMPEGDYFNDKRADIRIAYRNDFELPIEIKRENNASLWSALSKQLIGQYTIAPKARGYGIYLVLWFGKGDFPASGDGGKKPKTPEELRERLEAMLDPEERTRISVRVLDVSWPGRQQ